MAVVGIGIDVCAVARMATMLRRTPTAAGRLFTAGEIAYAGDGPTAAARFAARFAAKEAVVKALGGGTAEMRWQDIEVVVVDGTAPRLVVGGAAAKRAVGLGVVRWHLSLTHDSGLAVAMVVAES